MHYCLSAGLSILVSGDIKCEPQACSRRHCTNKSRGPKRHRRPQSHLILSSTQRYRLLNSTPTHPRHSRKHDLGNGRCRLLFGHHVPSLIPRKKGVRERGNSNHRTTMEATNKLLHVNRSQILTTEFFKVEKHWHF